MSEQLKPCPFCGADAELDSQQGFRRMSDGVIRTGIAAYCVKCSAQIHFCRDDIPNLTPEFVINLWNTRAEQPEKEKCAKCEIMSGLAGEFEVRCHELMTALKIAHDAMHSWFSSEYADHPTSHKVAREISKGIVPIKPKEVMTTEKSGQPNTTRPDSVSTGAAQSEQNTQRPTLFNRVEHCAYKDGCGLIQSHPLCPSCAEWYRAKFYEPPAPQTEAGDVVKLVNSIAEQCVQDLASKEKSTPNLPVIRYYCACLASALTQRIAELQSIVDSAALIGYGNAVTVAIERQQQRAETAEARVKELEQKLAGALKVTTENTIAHMQTKP